VTHRLPSPPRRAGPQACRDPAPAPAPATPPRARAPGSPLPHHGASPSAPRRARRSPGAPAALGADRPRSD
jgi:hypothetical protein